MVVDELVCVAVGGVPVIVSVPVGVMVGVCVKGVPVIVSVGVGVSVGVTSGVGVGVGAGATKSMLSSSTVVFGSCLSRD